MGIVAFIVLVLLAACTPPPPPDADAVVADPMAWAGRVQGSVAEVTSEESGLHLPYGANVLAARIFAGGDAPAYVYLQAGGGGFVDNFFPASSIKLLAALGALDFARSLGFTGEAVVDGSYTLHEYYDAALRYSSNEDYSMLVRIAGVDRLNRQFLPDHGFQQTLIQEPYGAGEQVTYSPAMTFAEGDHEVTVPEREGDSDYGCSGSNCTTLFDMADALRRVVLDVELPAGDRFDLDPADIAGMKDALLGAEGFIGPGVADALGPDAYTFTKPGWVPSLDCVETAIVVDPTTGHRFLIALSAPDDGACEELSTMAYDILRLLDNCDDGTALREDGRRVGVVDGRQSGSPLPEGRVTLQCHIH